MLPVNSNGYCSLVTFREVFFVNKVHSTFGNLVHHEAVTGQVVNSKVFGKIIWSGDFYCCRKEWKKQRFRKLTSVIRRREMDNFVITIARQYGSGGHDIGKMLAEKLGFDFYDQEIIKMAAGTTGLTSDFISKNEESMTNSFLYDLVNQVYIYSKSEEEAPKDKIFEAESRVIKELAEKGNCVIVGRCSDYILRDHANVLKIFFSAPMESREKRVMGRLNVSEKEAERKIRREDKLRSDNYHYYTGRMWGAAANFDLTLNTDLGEDYIEKCVMGALNQ